MSRAANMADQRRAEALRLRQSGLTLRQIGLELGITKQGVSLALIRAGCPPGPRGRPKVPMVCRRCGEIGEGGRAWLRAHKLASAACAGRAK